ncbi:hypothetical protein GGI20_004836 [Coemansia sp. BCRC 34301]|nr:hypothetical protein GGI20_004836 [Coemansia sp. BCRC 34301]
MSFVCSISGETPVQPVVSAKTGRVYEYRLLQKYLSENGRLEPQTTHELSEDDMVRVSADPPGAAKPRPPTLTSIPALLSTFQNEWDALVLETFSLKQQYQQVRQELSQALYQNDAACRVVARLMRERDEARQALATLQAQVSSLEPPPSLAAATTKPDGMEVDTTNAIEHSDPADAYYATVAEAAKTLSASRVKREVPADLTSADAWKTGKEVSAVTSLHSTTKPGITALDVDGAGALLLTGGMDNHAEVYSRESDQVIGTLKGHTKRVTACVWLGVGGGATQPIITASADKSVRLWTAKPANSAAEGAAELRAIGWVKKAIVKHHSAEVVGLAVHPSAAYFASAAANGSWAVHSAESGAVVVSGSIEAPISQVAYHPDGVFLALATADGLAKIFDIKLQQVLATLDVASTADSDDSKRVLRLHFSENGYYFATVTKTEVAVWDLRKQKKTMQWSLADLDASPDSLGFVDARFDFSGKFLAIALPAAIHVLKVKGWLPLVSMPCTDSVQSVQWIGHLSTAIVAACLENSLHVYEPAN